MDATPTRAKRRDRSKQGRWEATERRNTGSKRSRSAQPGPQGVTRPGPSLRGATFPMSQRSGRSEAVSLGAADRPPNGHSTCNLSARGTGRVTAGCSKRKRESRGSGTEGEISPKLGIGTGLASGDRGPGPGQSGIRPKTNLPQDKSRDKKRASDPHRGAATSYRCCLPALTGFRGSCPCGTCPIRCGASPRNVGSHTTCVHNVGSARLAQSGHALPSQFSRYVSVACCPAACRRSSRSSSGLGSLLSGFCNPQRRAVNARPQVVDT